MHSREHELARYYTPRILAQELVRWAVDGDRDALLFDPCFGSGVFLHAALDVFSRLGLSDGAKRVFGVDIDPSAQGHLAALFDAGASRRQFLKRDFFDSTAGSFLTGAFSAVVGNPPYLRHHALPTQKWEKADRAAREAGITLSRKASYWAFFILHSMGFLRKGGRLALVLPNAFLQADYAGPIRQKVCQSFRFVQVFLVRERLFEKAEEQTLLLLADGWGEPNREVSIQLVSGIKDLPRVIRRATRFNKVAKTSDVSLPQTWMMSLLEPVARRTYEKLSERPYVAKLGSKAIVALGVVTGANEYFVVGQGFLPDCQCYLMPVVSHASHLRGLSFRNADFSRMQAAGKACLLLRIPPDTSFPQKLTDYLEIGSRKGINERTKCLARPKWYSIQDTWIPDAFLTYMAGRAPRVIVNETKACCTNTIHRLRACSEGSADWPILAAGTLSTLFQLSCELQGRSFGGGVLKVDLRRARELLVPLLSLDQKERDAVLAQLDGLLRQRKCSQASELVDALMVRNKWCTESEINVLREAVDSLRRVRQPAIRQEELEPENP